MKASIHAMGGDCPGKTELSAEFLKQVKLVVEYKPQSLVEGEAQQCAADLIHAELWELVCKKKPGRQNHHEITLFDSVGFALEDYSILRVIHELAKEYQLGTELPLIPELNDPKNLFDLLTPWNIVLQIPTVQAHEYWHLKLNNLDKLELL